MAGTFRCPMAIQGDVETRALHRDPGAAPTREAIHEYPIPDDAQWSSSWSWDKSARRPVEAHRSVWLTCPDCGWLVGVVSEPPRAEV